MTADSGVESRYLLPLVVKWVRFSDLGPLLPSAAAAVRRGPREGSLLDAGSDRDFIALLLKSIHAGQTLSAGDQRIEFHSDRRVQGTATAVIEKLIATDREQSNTTSIADGNYVIKLLRKVNAGVHPEIEVGRFLLDAGFKNAPDLLGWAELVEGDNVRPLRWCTALSRTRATPGPSPAPISTASSTNSGC